MIKAVIKEAHPDGRGGAGRHQDPWARPSFIVWGQVAEESIAQTAPGRDGCSSALGINLLARAALALNPEGPQLHPWNLG